MRNRIRVSKRGIGTHLTSYCLSPQLLEQSGLSKSFIAARLQAVNDFVRRAEEHAVADIHRRFPNGSCWPISAFPVCSPPAIDHYTGRRT